jgi:hypothetical protein
MSIDQNDQNQIAALIRQLTDPLKKEILRLRREHEVLTSLAQRAKSVQEEIDAIPGRRIFYTLSGNQTFDIGSDGIQGQPIPFLVSQDGPFIMTHYPVIMWKPSAPAAATNFGKWRPVASWPLPAQVVSTDIIDVSYAMTDGGSQRNFQNLPVLSGLISRPDNMIPLPVPTLFTPNTVVQLTPTYENILFNGAPDAPTQGLLVAGLPGYRIVNL